MNIIKMLYYDRIDISEGFDVNETSESKQCDICHYWYVLNKGFKFQSYTCNKCHDLVMMSMILNNIAILNIKDTGYCCIVSGISQNKAMKFMQNIDLNEKSGTS